MLHLLDMMNINFDDIGNLFQYVMIVVGVLIFICLMSYTVDDYHHYKDKTLDDFGNPVVTKKKMQKVIIFDIMFVVIVMAYIAVRSIF